MAVEILTKEKALPLFMSPTGRSYKVIPSDKVQGTFEIANADGQLGTLPDELTHSVFTGRQRAEKHLRQFLSNFWDKSDAASQKAKQKN